jgi:hypothetical protein
VMVLAILAGGWLVTFQAVDLLLGMHAELVFVDDGILLVGVAWPRNCRSGFPG